MNRLFGKARPLKSATVRSAVNRHRVEIAALTQIRIDFAEFGHEGGICVWKLYGKKWNQAGVSISSLHEAPGYKHYCLDYENSNSFQWVLIFTGHHVGTKSAPGWHQASIFIHFCLEMIRIKLTPTRMNSPGGAYAVSPGQATKERSPGMGTPQHRGPRRGPGGMRNPDGSPAPPSPAPLRGAPVCVHPVPGPQSFLLCPGLSASPPFGGQYKAISMRDDA